MKILLLLAGRSRRFWPLQEKSLFSICGKTLLEHQLDRLRAAGCSDIILVGGAHNLADVRERFPDLPTVEQEDLELGMRGALLSALPECGDEPVMIVSSNDVIEPAAYSALLESGGDGALLAQKVDRYFPGGYLSVDSDRITGIVEKPGEGNEPSDLVNIVAHVHRDPQALFDALQDINESSDDGYEQALAKLFPERMYSAVAYEGAWQAVKYPWHLLELLPTFLSEITEQDIHPSTDIHESVVIQGNVVIGEGTKIYPNASIMGPCTIGKNCIIGHNALVRGSSVGDNSIVGYTTEVKASILESDVWSHMNYIGDSVLGSNVGLGSGTVTGNLRLDETEIESEVDDQKVATGLRKFGAIIGSGSRLGIHVSLNPGVKVGGNTFISSKSMVSTDIPDGMFARMKDGVLKVSENREGTVDISGRDEFRKKL